MKSPAYRRFKSKAIYNLSRIHIFKYIVLIFLVISLACVFMVYNNVFKPQLRQLAESKAYFLVNLAVDEAVSDVLTKSETSYEELVTFLKDDVGNITGIMTNLIAINRLKSEFSVRINSKIQGVQQTSVSIPLGNLTGLEVFSGLGPRIKIYLIPNSTTLIDFENSFSEAGINQTRHEIYLNVKTIVSILMPDTSKVSSDISLKIPITESIIVGRVPDTLTRIETEEANIREDAMNLVN